jgi:hypothetical protein
MMGQLFHRFDAPNRFGLPAFYTLHVWAWRTSHWDVLRELERERLVRRVLPDSTDPLLWRRWRLRHPHRRCQITGTMFERQFASHSEGGLVMLTLVNVVLAVMALVVVYWGLRVLLSRGS